MTIVGLILDIFGAVIIIWDGLKSQAAVLKQAGSVIFTPNENWLKKFTFFLASKFGSSNPQNTQNYFGESFVAKFWGFVLLCLGFIFQVIGAL